MSLFKCNFFRTMTSSVSELTWSNFLWRQQWKELEVLLSPQNRESFQLGSIVTGGLPSSQGQYIKPSLPEDTKNKRIREGENKDTWCRIHWEESGKKQEL